MAGITVAQPLALRAVAEAGADAMNGFSVVAAARLDAARKAEEDGPFPDGGGAPRVSRTTTRAFGARFPEFFNYRFVSAEDAFFPARRGNMVA